MLDKYKREITYLRISVTDRCNLRCFYCMPQEGVKLKNQRDILPYEDIVRIAREAANLGITKIRLTGGEPLVRKDICFLIRSLKLLDGIKEVTLTTNGVLLSQMVQDLKESGLDRINISLDTLDPQKYKELTRGEEIYHALNGIDAAIKAAFSNIKLNMVIIPGFNENEIEAMSCFCTKKGLLLQRINHYVLTEGVSTNQEYEAERPLSCEKCNRIRLTADGKLKPCLFSDQEYPIDLDNIADSIKQTIDSKPERGLQCTARGIWEIGG